MSGKQWKRARWISKSRAAILDELKRTAPRWRRWLAKIYPAQLDRWADREDRIHDRAKKRVIKKASHSTEYARRMRKKRL